MPYKRRASYSRRSYPRAIVNSIKNIHIVTIGITNTTQQIRFAKAVTSPSPTVTSDVSHGCIIKAVWISVDACGLGGTGVVNNVDFFVMKNPGDNLTFPAADSVGGSNEKKFVFRQWHAMIMRNQDGNVPYHWEGWLRIPKRYQRMGTDDTLVMAAQCTSGVTGHFSVEFLYKWFR